MIEVVVSLSMATICFLGQCFPALVGNETPQGFFSLQHAGIMAPGYGGDVLVFDKGAKGEYYAVHRVWLGRPQERRLARLESPNVAGRKGITGGCVNVTPEVYDKLVDCCAGGTIRVTP